MAEDRALYPELKIDVRGDGTVVASAPGQEGPDGKINSDDLLLETLKTFRDWLNQRKLIIRDERDLTLLGKLLYRLLFSTGGPKIKKLVDDKLKAARGSKKRICVQLAFHDSKGDLASLPWEFLYDPDNSCFFATDIDLILTRYVSGDGVRQSLCSNEPPLHMLIVVSKPKGLGTVADAKEIEAIQKFGNEHKDRIVLHEPVVNKNYLELQDCLEGMKNRLQLVHFIGHGRYNKAQRQGELALVAMDGEGGEWVSQGRFKRLFTDSGCIPRLLFLQLCEGAVVEGAELISSFEGLAPALVSANVQAVVAMQFPIKVVHAGKITTKFYDELTGGRSVGEALQAARRLVSTYDAVAGGTPVLYMFGYDGAIVSAPRAAPRTTGGGILAGAYSDAAGSSPGEPESGPTAVTPSPAPEPLQGPPASGGLSTALDEVLGAGVREIKAMKDKGDVTDDESIALNRALFLKLRPALRSKTAFEITKALADHLERETGTPLSKVLEKMFNKAGKMS